MMLLHGEQYLELKKPIPTSGVFKSKARIIDVLQKKKAISVVVGVTTLDEKNEPVFENQITLFIRGVEGFGNTTAKDRGDATAENTIPSRTPDKVVREKVSEDLAALYRLSGDLNPLHIDPEMSKMGGFDVPILHGLASFGIAGKHILSSYCNNDTKQFKSIKVIVQCCRCVCTF
jgi:multifunctional beta-oxidation protein